MADADAERFKRAMLRVAAENDPWNTGMAWSDAIDGLPGHTQAEIDRIVEESLLDLLESGYIFFFQARSFDDEFARRTEADALDKAEVLAAFEQGDLRQPGFIGLSFRATDAGRDHFATLPDEASRLFPARDTDGRILRTGRHEPSAFRISDRAYGLGRRTRWAVSARRHSFRTRRRRRS